MNIQEFINTANELAAKGRSGYHLTLRGLIKALEDASPDVVFDGRVKGIGSWRGSYVEIALFTEEEGYYAEKSEYSLEGRYGSDEYKKWKAENTVEGLLPSNARELAEVLRSLVGLQFVGYKGGNYTIEEWKPLWLEKNSGSSGNIAIVGIDKELRLVTKEVQ